MYQTFLFVIISSASLLFCKESCSNEKIKISPREVHVSDQGIFVLVGEEWVPVELSRNSHQFSIKPLSQIRSWGLFWTCECNALNSSLAQNCHVCGKGRYDYNNADDSE